jgi:hypothetical protein
MYVCVAEASRLCGDLGDPCESRMLVDVYVSRLAAVSKQHYLHSASFFLSRVFGFVL